MRKTFFTEFHFEDFQDIIKQTIFEAFAELSKSSINDPPKEEQNIMLSSKEASALLKISAPTLIKLRKEGKVKARKIGAKLFYSKNEILKLLK